MKIALAQQNYMIGDFEGNLQKMLSAIQQAKQAKTDLIIFSELSVCGYPPRDFLEFNHFINQCHKDIEAIAKVAANDIAVIVGAPSKNPNKEGKDLYNSAYCIAEGKVQYVAHKTLLPTYDVFDEYRYFEPNKQFDCFHFKGKKIAVTICEDIWDTGEENPLYSINPVAELAKLQPDFLVNLSASPFNYKQAKKRIDVIRKNATIFNLPVFYCNCVGAQTELIFDGGSVVMSPNGKVYKELKYFEEELFICSLDEVLSNDTNHENNHNELQLIHDALICGIRDYFKKLNFKTAILGLSGGIDSALTLVLAVRALGKENVLSVLMPSQFSTNHSVDDSIQLLENLGNAPHKIIPIKEVYDSFIDKLQPHFNNKPFDVTEENMQARIRAVYLMALSNKLGCILLNTSNKSEAAVGYGTLYGDMCGGISVLGDVYKTKVFELCKFINKDQEIIPWHIINKPPSAELRPDQKDSDSLPEYSILDTILYEYIENRKGPDEIEALGFEEALVSRVLRMVNRNEFKRYQTPPILRVSTKAFGSGRRLPIVGKYLE
ncbi:MAG: NAD+ synthase [Chitinophagales bacterium]|nr:NAD+ synthase [Chitinophagales bacterium]